MAISFAINKSDERSQARLGEVSTQHGSFQTPAFSVVGTKATVKALTPSQLKRLGAQVVLANTYHLFLRPGEDIVAQGGGLGQYMSWSGPTITDSGGFQVFSLGEGYEKGASKFAKEEKVRSEGLTTYNQELASEHGRLAVIDEEGVTFTSHIDGSMHRLTPERSIEIQHQLGADIIFAFDECTSPEASYEYQREAMERTHQWARRSLQAHLGNLEQAKKQGLFGIVQGGRHEDLRIESAQFLTQMDFAGYGIGGSFSKEDLEGALQVVNEYLPKDKPRHLLGIGEPLDILMGVEAGCDTFDCVLPTRLGRTGYIYTKKGKVNVKRAEFKDDFTRLSEWCPLFEDETYTRSYLHHLYRENEILASTLGSIINLWFILHLMQQIRESLEQGRFSEFKKEFTQVYSK